MVKMFRCVKLARALLATAFLTTSQCAHRTSTASGRMMVRGVPLASNVPCSPDDCSSYNVDPAIRARTAVSVQCMGDAAPGSTPNPQPPPLSYLVADIGKSGMPLLSSAERAMIERFRRDVHSKTLRFAWVTYHAPMGDPIVFDAYDGPCTVASLGYAVLNGACNEYYKPGESPYRVFAAPGEDKCYHPSQRSRRNGQL